MVGANSHVVTPGQFDPVSLYMIDDADVDAVGSNHFHAFIESLTVRFSQGWPGQEKRPFQRSLKPDPVRSGDCLDIIPGQRVRPINDRTQISLQRLSGGSRVADLMGFRLASGGATIARGCGEGSPYPSG